MQRIRRQFGSRFADMLASCPSLVADVLELRRRNFKIRRVPGECRAWSEASKKTIFIGTRCKKVVQLIYLAHEAEHMLRGKTPDPSPKKLSRRSYIRRSLNEETQCLIHECQVAEELLAAGYKPDDDTMTWLRRYRRGGRKALRAAIEKTLVSGEGGKYPEFYRQQYNESA